MASAEERGGVAVFGSEVRDARSESRNLRLLSPNLCKAMTGTEATVGTEAKCQKSHKAKTGTLSRPVGRRRPPLTGVRSTVSEVTSQPVEREGSAAMSIGDGIRKLAVVSGTLYSLSADIIAALRVGVTVPNSGNARLSYASKALQRLSTVASSSSNAG